MGRSETAIFTMELNPLCAGGAAGCSGLGTASPSPPAEISDVFSPFSSLLNILLIW